MSAYLYMRLYTPTAFFFNIASLSHSELQRAGNTYFCVCYKGLVDCSTTSRNF